MGDLWVLSHTGPVPPQTCGQGQFPLKLTGLISSLSKGFSKVFSSIVALLEFPLETGCPDPAPADPGYLKERRLSDLFKC